MSITTSPSRRSTPARTRANFAALLAIPILLGLGGCARSAAPSDVSAGAPAGPAASSHSTAPSPAKTTTSAKGKATSTTSTSAGPAMPPVLTSAPSPVNASTIRGLGDLQAAVKCPAQVPPVAVPAKPPVPAAVVCTSPLVGDPSKDGQPVYLWFVGSPQERYDTVTAALATSKHVASGPNWVAATVQDTSLTGVGGDIYK